MTSFAVARMFTGLVRAVGRLERCPAGVRIRGDLGPLGPLALGDSVAVDGVCLTVAERLEGGAGFRADVSEETLGRTTLGERAAAGCAVNLEPALRLSDRLGGHLVSGHVDGLGTVRGIRRLADSWRLEIAWRDPRFGRYVCEKASVAVDGISLTVAGCDPDGSDFWIAVIPHTWATTTLAGRRVGDAVNLEADLLAKYAERLLRAGPSPSVGHAGESAAPGAPGGAPGGGDGDLDADWLARHGW